MLDYVAHLNQKQGNQKRIVVCLAVSCLLHLGVILTLITFPGLLAGGYYHAFRGLRWGASPDHTEDTDTELWRTVAILPPPERMDMPSPEMLRKILGLADKDEGAGTPPVRVSFTPPREKEPEQPPLPQIPPEIEKPEVVVPDNRPASPVQTATDAGETSPVAAEPRAKVADPGTGNDVTAAKPQAKPAAELAENLAPTRIPETIRPPEPPPAPKAPAQEAPGRNSGIEFSETQGFPLGDYKRIVEERIRANWNIPSNLKDTLGKTVVSFYIYKDGRCSGLRVESSSGYNSLDLAALSAITGSDPFPPLPKGFPGPRIKVRIALIYEP